MKNLYFVYLVELRALSKAAPYLANETFYVGRSKIEDEDTKQAILKLLDITKGFDNHFDENSLFRTNMEETLRLKVYLF